VQTGLRTSTDTIPNGASLPPYAVINLSAVQKITPRTVLRLDVLNLADNTYQIRDGSGVGVGAPQYGIRRAILAGITQRF
jgi:outer membrane receptor protein involved in Fe transport